jgi:uncharacterized LabA/DUF88 family protein
MKPSGERIYAFIDSQNLNLAVRNDIYNKQGILIYRGWNLDFQKLLIYFRVKYMVDKAFLFIGNMKGNEKLYLFLQKAGYNLVFKPAVEYFDSTGKRMIKGNVDAELVLHSMIELPNYDKAIIVAGDGDYCCLLDYLKKNNKLAKLAIPNKYSYSSLLKPYLPYAVYISDLKSSLERI